MEKFQKIWKALYSNLITSQIEKTLRDAGLTYKDWLEFCEYMSEVNESFMRS